MWEESSNRPYQQYQRVVPDKTTVSQSAYRWTVRGFEKEELIRPQLLIYKAANQHSFLERLVKHHYHPYRR